MGDNHFLYKRNCIPARDTFYRIYQRDARSDSVDSILKQLDFHPLSVTLFATVAHQSKWSTKRLVKRWEERRTRVLQTEHNKSLAATIELSLTSPMFEELGPDARELLGAIAFFPQGVNEDNIDWLFPTAPNGAAIFDKFCILSLTHRNGGFITMLAPLRDYLSPKDPTSSQLLCTAKERYFARVSVGLDNANEPGFEEARWIGAEDSDVEHLLDTLTSIDVNPGLGTLERSGGWVSGGPNVDVPCLYKSTAVPLRGRDFAGEGSGGNM